MVCYKCGAETHVINSRHQKRTNQVWRRRSCILCDVVFTSIETTDYAKSFLVRLASQQLQAFNRDRLLLSLYKSLGHRRTALDDAGGLSATIIAKLLPLADNGVLTHRQIIETTIVALNRFDKLAAQHYQAMHTL